MDPLSFLEIIFGQPSFNTGLPVLHRLVLANIFKGYHLIRSKEVDLAEQGIWSYVPIEVMFILRWSKARVSIRWTEGFRKTVTFWIRSEDNGYVRCMFKIQIEWLSLVSLLQL